MNLREYKTYFIGLDFNYETYFVKSDPSSLSYDFVSPNEIDCINWIDDRTDKLKKLLLLVKTQLDNSHD